MLASEVCLVCLLSLSSLVASFVSVGMVPIVLSNTSIRLHGQPSELRNCNITLPYHKWSPKRSPSPGFPDHLQQKKWSPQTIHGTVDGLPFNHLWHNNTTKMLLGRKGTSVVCYQYTSRTLLVTTFTSRKGKQQALQGEPLTKISLLAPQICVCMLDCTSLISYSQLSHAVTKHAYIYCGEHMQ